MVIGLKSARFIKTMIEDKITEWNMAVIVDCLHGSLCLKDRLSLWKFSEEQREATLNKLYSLMNSVESNTFQKNKS